MIRMGLRMLGILVIFLAACLFGSAMEFQVKKRWMILRELRELFRFLQKEMIYHRSPLEEALLLAAKSGMQETGEMLRRIAEEMKKRNGRTFQEIWGQAVACCLGNILEPTALDAVKDAYTALCNTDVVLQKVLLEKQENLFEGLCRDAECGYREKSGLYRKLGAVGGIFLILVLL